MTGTKLAPQVHWGSWAFDQLAALPSELRTTALISTVSLLVDEEPGGAGISRLRREVAYWLDFWASEPTLPDPLHL